MLNYLREDLAFLEKGRELPLSPRAHVLWHYLLYFNNAAAIQSKEGDWYWPVWFVPDNRVLVRAMGLKGSNKIYDYRHRLVEAGLIRCRLGCPEGGRPAAMEYALNPVTPGVSERCLCLPGYPDGIDVWVSAPEGASAEDRQSSYYNKCINPVNNQPAICPPAPALPPAWEDLPFEERCKDFDYVKTLTGEEHRIAMRVFCNMPMH